MPSHHRANCENLNMNGSHLVSITFKRTVFGQRNPSFENLHIKCTEGFNAYAHVGVDQSVFNEDLWALEIHRCLFCIFFKSQNLVTTASCF